MNHNPYRKIDDALDRFQEAHFWIHMMEKHYHDAGPFRWYLNAFLKACKEVPDVVSHAMQNEPAFPGWFRGQREELRDEPVLKLLSSKRDLVVHRKMLVPNSKGTLGVAEGSCIRRGITVPIDPEMDSDKALLLGAVRMRQSDILGLLTRDDDSQPCVQREWRLPEFDEELVDLCARAWLRVGETLRAVLRRLGTDPPPLSLDCRHSGPSVRLKLYDRNELIENVRAHLARESIPQVSA